MAHQSRSPALHFRAHWYLLHSMKYVLRTCDVHDLPLEVEAESSSLWGCAESVLGPFVVSSRSSGAYSLRIRYGDPPSPRTEAPGLHCSWRGRRGDGIELVCYSAEGVERMDLLGLGSIEIHRPERHAQITIDPSAERSFPRTCIVPVLYWFLGEIGHHVIHAASICVLQNNEQRVVLLAGPSGSGKTTVSLALGYAGMKMMGEDACFVTRRTHGGTEELVVWGLLLDSKVHRKTRTLLPWLNSLPSRPAWTEDEDIITTRQVVGVTESIELKPAAILFLDSLNERDHEITSLNKVDALSKLARENVRAPNSASHARAAQAFGLLAELVECCDTYSVSLGPRLDGLEHKVLSLLGG